MNWRKLPVIPTLLVLAAAGYMVHLGFWQLGRLAQKEAKIARFTAAQGDRSLVSIGEVWRYKGSDARDFHRTQFWCRQVLQISATAGRNAAGQGGWAHVARCLTAPVDTQGFHPTEAPKGVLADVVLGWSNKPDPVTWTGGQVRGIVVPGGEFAHHVVADPALAGLAENAQPDPRDLPNNHLSYAVQWFLFALTAVVIYGLAVRKRVLGSGDQEEGE